MSKAPGEVRSEASNFPVDASVYRGWEAVTARALFSLSLSRSLSLLPGGVLSWVLLLSWPTGALQSSAARACVQRFHLASGKPCLLTVFS